MNLPIVFGLCSQLLMFKMLLPITEFEYFQVDSQFLTHR